MSNVKRAIIISDIHLGKEEGYLYSRNSSYDSNKKALQTLLASIGPCDQLILNGDILELAIAGIDEAYHELAGFFQLLSEVGSFPRIVYLPGNHDHHFWRVLGEQVLIHGRLIKGVKPPGHGVYATSFVDQRFSSSNPDHEPYIIFPHLWPTARSNATVPEFIVKYPHHLVNITDSDGHYLINHGHFLEDLFKPVNYLIDPDGLAQLEAFNNIWLETFNYNLGHSDELSDKTRELEKRFSEGGKEAKEKVKDIMDAVYQNMKKKMGLKFPFTCLLKLLLKQVIKKVPKEKMGESKLRGAEVNDDLLNGVKQYIEKYIINRYSATGTVAHELTQTPGVPLPFTFIFGHTHIPFSRDIVIDGKTYPLMNTGGWLRSDGDASGNGKYAGVIELDQKGATWHSLHEKLS